MQRSFGMVGEAGARYGEPYLVQPRLGQGAFRVLVTDSYRRRCAITGEKTLPALEAAHIRPYSYGGSHEASNGLLLRRDLHSLFDAGYVTVTPRHRFVVSRRIKDSDNGPPLRPAWAADEQPLNWDFPIHGASNGTMRSNSMGNGPRSPTAER